MQISILRAFTSLASLTLLSRVSGFLRVAIFAACFGGGSEADIFLAVMILPELMYRFMTDGLIAGAAVPMFVAAPPESEEERATFWTLFWGLTALTLPVTFALIIAAGPICGTMVPGFLPEAQARMTLAWRIIAPYVIFSLLGALAVAFLNARASFAAPAFGPCLVNLVVIAGIVLFRDRPVEWLAGVVLLSIIVQFVWLLGLACSRFRGIHWPWQSGWWRSDRWHEFLQKSAPVAAWIFLTPIVPLFERYLLSHQGVGAISVLNYTDKILFLPLGIVSLSLASAVFPRLSETAPEDRGRLLGKVFWGLACFLLPTVAILYAGSEAVTEVIYRRGQFGQHEVALTARLLAAYAVVLLPVSLSLLLNRLFFAMGLFRLTFAVGAGTVLVQVLADSALVHRFGAVGVGWGAALAALVQMLLFLGILARRAGITFVKPLLAPLLAMFGATVGLVPITGRLLEAAMQVVPTGLPGRFAALIVVWVTLQAPLFAALWWRRKALA